MALRTHRIERIVYAENGLCAETNSAIFDAIEEHPETNDLRNGDGGGTIELPLFALKEILEEAKEQGTLSKEDIDELEKEINSLVSLGKEDEDYIIYDCF
jgi:hypothetical protein